MPQYSIHDKHCCVLSQFSAVTDTPALSVRQVLECGPVLTSLSEQDPSAMSQKAAGQRTVQV